MKLFGYRRLVSGAFQPDSGLSDRFLLPESHFSFSGLPALPPASLHSSLVMDVRLWSLRHTSSVLTAAFHRVFPVLFQSTALVASSSD
ncbi:hypothetical protein Bca4012_098201 [Brassica carinata]